MLRSVIFSLPLLVASAVASPTWGQWHGQGRNACLSNSTVQNIIESYTYLLQSPQGDDFNATANALLSDSFFVSSDSINTLVNANGGMVPLGVNAYPSKKAFIAGQAQTPAIPSVETLGYFYSCDQIAWRWNGTGIGSQKYEVKGLITFDVNVASSQVDAVYSEFNSAAWLSDIGNPECKSA